MGKRLISKAQVDAWDKDLVAAITKAYNAQVDEMNRTLRRHGIETSLTAAGPKKAHGALVKAAVIVPFLWSQRAWERYVNDYLADVADDVSSSAASQAAGAIPGTQATWGMDLTGAAMAGTIIGRAVAAGAAIGDRVNTASIGPDLMSSVGGVLDGGSSILSDIVGAMSQATANMASTDLATYLVSTDAPTYLSATKSWVNVGDDRVRDSHQDVDDVQINEQFEVGGGMDGPGDPGGPDDETINCRCHTEFDGLVPDGAELPYMEGENA